jgi:hypothetical protein
MNLFGRIAEQGCIDDDTNFRTVPNAMLTLFGLATGDGFACTVHSCMVQERGKSYAIKGACSEALGTCGEPRNARLFFVLFELIIMFTTMELFVNIILDTFERLTATKRMLITRDDLEDFVAAWARHDNSATGQVPLSAVPELLEQLQENVPAIGFEERSGEEQIRLHELRLPERPGGTLSRWLMTRDEAEASSAADGNYLYLDPNIELSEAPDDATVHFLELLYGLCEKKCGCIMPRGNVVVDGLRRKLAMRMPTVKHLFEDTAQDDDNAVDKAPTEKEQQAEHSSMGTFENPVADAEEDKQQQDQLRL